MNGYVLFEMWPPFRQSLIDAHLFYVDQAKMRLLSQFENIEQEADNAEKAWIEAHKGSFDPEWDDEGSFVERAYNASVEFYQLLTDMQQQTYLNVTAGMFHEWDKQLRSWLTHQINFWHSGKYLFEAVWKANFDRLVSLLEYLGMDIKNQAYYCQLDACRLVVNTYKHGKGDSLDVLRKKYSDYLPDPFHSILNDPNDVFCNPDYVDHTHLRVTDEQLQAFADAIVSFWQAIPHQIPNSDALEVPDWFAKAMEKDNKEVESHG